MWWVVNSTYLSQRPRGLLVDTLPSYLCWRATRDDSGRCCLLRPTIRLLDCESRCSREPVRIIVDSLHSCCIWYYIPSEALLGRDSRCGSGVRHDDHPSHDALVQSGKQDYHNISLKKKHTHTHCYNGWQSGQPCPLPVSVREDSPTRGVTANKSKTKK